MSKKSKALIEEVKRTSFELGYCTGEPIKPLLMAETAALTELENYIDGLHQRIAELHRGTAQLRQWNTTQASTIRLWRSRAVALGYTTPVSPSFNELKAQADTYQGHAGTTGGLQQHSVGELYPCIIAKVGQHWQVDHASLGTLQSNFPTQADTVAYAKHFKDNDR